MPHTQRERTHAHVASSIGPVYEVCECGAVRTRERPGSKSDAWHVCDRCRTSGAVAMAHTLTTCAGCGKVIVRLAPALPYAYCRICRGR